jgi:glycosyltransferase involved in cell wall biosynthesis
MDGAVDHIQNGENGLMLYHPQQPVELAARIQEGLDLGESERARLSQNARESVLPLTWEKHMTEWLEVIEASRR